MSPRRRAWGSHLKITRKIIRVGLSFNDEDDPKWFALLQKVTNGHSRTGILRAHLSAPTEPFLRKFDGLPAHDEPLRKTSAMNPKKSVIPTETPTLQANPEEVAPKLTVATEISKAPSLVNSPKTDTGLTGNFLPKEAQRKIEQAAPEPKDNNNPDAPQAGTVRRSGMASMLLNKGRNGI